MEMDDISILLQEAKPLYMRRKQLRTNIKYQCAVVAIVAIFTPTQSYQIQKPKPSQDFFKLFNIQLKILYKKMSKYVIMPVRENVRTTFSL